MTQNHKITFMYLLWLYLTWTLYVGLLHQGLTSLADYGDILVEVMRLMIFIAPLFFIFKKANYPNFSDLGFHGNFFKNLSIGIVAAFIFIAIAAPLTMLLKGKELGIENISTTPVSAALTIAIVVEEVVFRGYILNSFIDLGKAKAVLISSLFFLLIHFPGWWILDSHPSTLSWITTSGNIFILGIILGYLYLKFKSLWVCILVHSANNLVAAIAR